MTDAGTPPCDLSMAPTKETRAYLLSFENVDGINNGRDNPTGRRAVAVHG